MGTIRGAPLRRAGKKLLKILNRRRASVLQVQPRFGSCRRSGQQEQEATTSVPSPAHIGLIEPQTRSLNRTPAGPSSATDGENFVCPGAPDNNGRLMRRALCLSVLLPCFFAAAALGAEVSYTIRTVAGSDFVGDGGPASSALLLAPECLARDAAGNLYIADPADHRVRKINTWGIITTIAGTGHAGFSGDGAPATQAQLHHPYGLTVDAAGNLYIADFGNGRVRKVGVDGIIRTVAGGGAADPSAGGGEATSARLVGPRNVALDRFGNLYISDFLDHRVYQVSAAGRIRLLAGTGSPGLAGNGGPAAYAQLNCPAGLAPDAAGNLFIADSGNRRVRRLAAEVLSTLNVPVSLELPTGLTFDAAGNLYIADRTRVVKLAASGAATVLQVAARDLATDATGNLYAASGAPQILRITAGGVFSVIAGATTVPRFWGDGAQANVARLDSPRGLALGPDGALWIADTGNARIRKVTAEGVISTVAGAGGGGTVGELVPATSARLFAPVAVAVDRAGNLWIADALTSRVRRVSPAGLIATAAGTGQAGYNGDGAAAISQLNLPAGVLADTAGNVYIADTNNHRVRKLTPDGALITVAGRGIRGYGGDGGPATEALLDSPRGLALDGDGNLYIADRMNHAVRKVSPSGLISTVAGTGLPGAGGDGGPARQARLNHPLGVAVDSQGNLYIADTDNHRVRQVSADGLIKTIAGDGSPGFSGDDGPARQARLRYPAAVAVDAAGNVFVADQDNHRVRQLVPTVAAASVVLDTAAVVNAASLLPGPVAPGQIVTILAAGIGPEKPVEGKLNGVGLLETRLGEVEVLWDGRPSPLLHAGPEQIRAQVPYAVAPLKETQLEVWMKGTLRLKMLLPVAESAPALFTVSGGAGQAAAINEDGTLNSASNPAPRGSVITLFATGEGQTEPPGQEGRPAADPLSKPKLPVTLTIGVHPAEILFAGSAPGLVGVLQINARIPGGFLPSGVLPVELTVGSARSQLGVTIAIR